MLTTGELRAGLTAARTGTPMLFHLRDPHCGPEEREAYHMMISHPYAVDWDDLSGPAEGCVCEYVGYGVIWFDLPEGLDYARLYQGHRQIP